MKVNKPHLTIATISDGVLQIVVDEYVIENNILKYRNYHDRKLVYHNFNDIRYMVIDYVDVEEYISSNAKYNLDKEGL